MITRQFVTLGERQAHLRRDGDGPPVLLLHDLPNSSRLLVPAIEALAQAGFTAIAPDLPGYGNSDPLPGEASIAACAQLIERLADALGLERFGLYGTHTGALIAGDLAARNPRRVAAAVLSAYPLFGPEERDDYRRNFFPPFEPLWHGGHLAWLWARMREQMIFFPWHSDDPADRLAYDIPPPEVLQQRAVDWLRGYEGHKGIYPAVFDEDPWPALHALPAPTVMAYWEGDVLAAHRLRLPVLPPGVTTEVVGGDRSAIVARLAGWMEGARDLPAPPPARPAEAEAGRLYQDFVQTPDGALAVRRFRGAGRPCLLLHDAGGSSALLADLAAALGVQRLVLAPDLPGHGESPAPAAKGLEGYLAPVLHLLDEGPMDVVGLGLGAAIAVELALRRPDRVASCLVHGLAPLPEALAAELARDGAPALAARWDGGHLLTAWHRIRDGQLFWPWYRRGKAGVRRDAPTLEPEALQRAVTELLKAGDGHAEAWRAWALYPVGERVAALERPPTAITSAADPLRPWLDAWSGPVVHLEGPPSAWAPALEALLARRS